MNNKNTKLIYSLAKYGRCKDFAKLIANNVYANLSI